MSNTMHGRKKHYYSMLTVLVTLGLTLTSYASVQAEGTAAAQDDRTVTLPEYVVTANRYRQPIREANADMSVVTRKQIEEMHMTNIEEALRTVPGVQFLNYGGNGLNANLSGIRINGSKNIVILVDGVRISDFQGPGNSGYAYLSLLNNMDNIQRIEVLRGSSSVKYGSGAEGGVINIITRKINKTRTKVSIIGSERGSTYTINSMGKEKDTSYQFYYNRTQQGGYVSPDGEEWNSNLDTISKGAKITQDFGARNNQHLMVSIDTVKSNYDGRDPMYANDYNGFYNSKRFTLQHRWDINKHLANEFTYRRVKEDTAYTQLADDPTQDFSIASKNTYQFVNNQLTFHDGYNDTVLGFEYAKDKTNGEMYDSEEELFTNVTRTMSAKSVYGQHDWHIFPNLTISGGLRYDKPEGDAYAQKMKSHLSKSYKIAVDVTPKSTVYASYGEFYILPSIMQLANKKYGNAALQPAQGWTKTLGYTHQINDRSLWTFNIFKTQTEKGIGVDKQGVYTNYVDGIARGWNAQYQARLGKYWNVNLGWSHLYQFAENDNYSLGYAPKDLATFMVLYDRKTWSVGLDGFYFIRRIHPGNENGWPSNKYGVYNMSVNYTPVSEMSMFMKVENIFNKEWAEHTKAIWGAPGKWYTMPGRTISVGSSASF